jgi:hypothetical protein
MNADSRYRVIFLENFLIIITSDSHCIVCSLKREYDMHFSYASSKNGNFIRNAQDTGIHSSALNFHFLHRVQIKLIIIK